MMFYRGRHGCRNWWRSHHDWFACRDGYRVRLREGAAKSNESRYKSKHCHEHAGHGRPFGLGLPHRTIARDNGAVAATMQAHAQMTFLLKN